MSKFVAGGLVLVALLAGGCAEAKGGKSGCSNASVDKCMEDCLAKGGKGKSGNNAEKCSKHCTKKKSC